MQHLYRDMTVAQLEIQYNARATVPDFNAEMHAYRTLSDEAYSDLTVLKDIAYGPHEDERIDLFPSPSAASPVLIFIHGGYWRALSRRESAFMANQFVSHGIAVAVVEYTLAPIATLSQIVDQMRRAVEHLIENPDNLPYDPNRIFLAGSSAGAHLAAMSLRSEIKGALLASGLYDLEPLRFCAPNEWLALTEETARENSPIHHPIPTDSPVIITWGETETDEFKRQSRDYADKIVKADGSAKAFEVPNRNHFNVITDLADSRSRVFHETLSMIRNA
ncbi:alpha/beta hydrolase [Boseongicola aestuarii]|uniref:Acetyl esterase n=1 Tax=Boseongicola aestuarii TaxID=1470561 RepID=A0A238IX60_9RHOB|nr:alpha/beta hydrolase [Boseongicola aestuarii]SMX23069.1 acetyl esterase [Boseongicola aestuarii]